MIDLKSKVTEFIDTETENRQAQLLEVDWRDSACIYYGLDLIAAIEAYLECTFTESEKELVIDWIGENQDACIEYFDRGFPHCSKNEFAIGSVGEFEVELPPWLARRNKDVINRHTDLYVCDYGLGYINCGYDFIGVNLDMIDIEEALNND